MSPLRDRRYRLFNRVSLTLLPRRLTLVATVVALVLLGACGGDGGEEPAVQADLSPAPAESSPAPTPAESPVLDDEGVQELVTLVSELESCLNAGGIETEVEEGGIPVYDEQATISLTFVYEAITVPDAVTLYIFESEQAAAKAKKAIDADLLEGDSETLLRGQVVVDDFGTTLQEPEAAEQAEVVESCTG